MGDGRKKRKKKRGKRKGFTSEQLQAMRAVREWAFPDQELPVAAEDQRLLLELHSHSIRSDGFLTPSALVERAHRRGVKVLALTDHDSLAGIQEAFEAARKFGMRIIPGVEISAVFRPREGAETEEPVHILAYYSSCGPSSYEELDGCLSSIRKGRYQRAKDILLKLNKLKKPLKWEHVTKIAGSGTAPGRLHVARAMVEAGHVENLREAFNRYLYDGGPAYATGKEPLAEEAVKLICRTGGVAALAHPWALKKPIPIIKVLKASGLHAVEVYRSDGKLQGFSDLCDTLGLLKVGGADFHGRGGNGESDLGSVNLPVVAVHEFLKVACPIWCNAIKDCLASFMENPSVTNLESLARFGKVNDNEKNASVVDARELVGSLLSSCLTIEEQRSEEFEELLQKLKDVDIT